MIRILVVDGERRWVELLRKGLPEASYHVTAALTGAQALDRLEAGALDIVLLGMELPDGDAMELLEKMKALYPATAVIMVIGFGSVDQAVKAMKLGAYDCLTRPTDMTRLSEALTNAYEAKRLRERTIFAVDGREDASVFQDRFVGESRQVCEIMNLVSVAGPSNAPVLILGETGTGKGLIAAAIHKAGSNPEGPFIAVNASALPEGIAESELFGHKKGAFTGATSDKTGLLQCAHKGTFFIDEVGDMDPAIQAKLLRAIETGTFRKVGDTREIKVDVRFVSASNKDLRGEPMKNTFRRDLFYRLSTFVIQVPPLRERKEDIPLLICYFLCRLAKRGKTKRISPEALRLMNGYPWPGNVRELSNMLERAYLMSAGKEEIDVDALPIDMLREGSKRPSAASLRGEREMVLLENAKRQHMEQVLAASEGNKSRAARLLGISRGRLTRRLVGR